MSDGSRQLRHRVHFSGRVQGVGFRYTTRNIAGRFAVTGYVENLPDGRVRLVAEGAADEVKRFVAAVEEEMRRCITGVDSQITPATGEFDDFVVQH